MIRTPAGAVLTAHAVASMLKRDVSPRDVDLVLAEPEQTYCCTRSDRTVHQRRDIAVVTADGAVVTVLYRLPPGWPEEQRRPSGRRISKSTRRRLAAELRRAGVAS